jgi:BMFP domain-containing protein YqiC
METSLPKDRGPGPGQAGDAAQPAIARARAERDALVLAMQSLEAALASPAPGRERAWLKQVASSLDELGAAVQQHLASTDAPGGLYQAVDQTWPTLMHRVERLRKEHASLAAQVEALRQQCAGYAPDETPNYHDLRRRAHWLLSALRHHQAAEADLIFEAFYTDIGIGD